MAILATKSLSPQQNAVARAVLRDLLRKQFAGEQEPLAEALGISQPFLSELIAGKKGIGGKTLIGLLELAPTASEQLGLGPRLAALPAARSAEDAATLDDAREAARRIAEAHDLEPEDVWPDFLQPFPKYKGEPWSVSGMVREVAKVTRQRLRLEQPDARAGAAPVMSAPPGPPSKADETKTLRGPEGSDLGQHIRSGKIPRPSEEHPKPVPGKKRGVRRHVSGERK